MFILINDSLFVAHSVFSQLTKSKVIKFQLQQTIYRYLTCIVNLIEKHQYE